MSVTRPAVLLVCLGNICRSPLAEAAFRAEAERAGVSMLVDSAGTGGWHVGNPPDPRSIAVAQKAGIDISGLQARQVVPEDFYRFSHVFAMDGHNLVNLRSLRPPDDTAELSLLLDLVPGREGASISDPYHDGEDQFELTWEDVSDAARSFVARFS